MLAEGVGVAVRDRKQSDDEDIESNLIDIRRYLQTHARTTARPEPTEKEEPSAWETYRHAEYSDGHRPRFSRSDLVLIVLILALAALVAIFVIY